jgi:hypothetical protein
MKFTNANNLDRKFGGSPTIASLSVRKTRVMIRKAFEASHYRPTYAEANVGHPFSSSNSFKLAMTGNGEDD